jgi:hypothetical protein
MIIEFSSSGYLIFVVYFYLFISLLIILFSKLITINSYKFILCLTEKLNLDEFFIFKVDDNNYHSLICYSRIFLLSFGITIFILTFYYYIFLSLI